MTPIRRHLLRLAGGAAAILAAAAAPADPPADPPLAAEVALILAEGEAAETRGRAGAADLLSAGRFLQAAGARPAESSLPDLGRTWWDEAIARGARGTPPVRGRPLGPAYRRARIEPGREATLEQLFLAGQRAEIALMPTRPAPQLMLEVSDSDGRTICRRRAEDPPTQCRWLPVFTTRHSIVIKNEGRAAADYFLVVN